MPVVMLDETIRALCPGQTLRVSTGSAAKSICETLHELFEFFVERLHHQLS